MTGHIVVKVKRFPTDEEKRECSIGFSRTLIKELLEFHNDTEWNFILMEITKQNESSKGNISHKANS